MTDRPRGWEVVIDFTDVLAAIEAARAVSLRMCRRALHSQRPDPDVMISNRFPLDDSPRALDQFRAGVGRKIHVRP